MFFVSLNTGNSLENLTSSVREVSFVFNRRVRIRERMGCHNWIQATSRSLPELRGEVSWASDYQPGYQHKCAGRSGQEADFSVSPAMRDLEEDHEICWELIIRRGAREKRRIESSTRKGEEKKILSTTLLSLSITTSKASLISQIPSLLLLITQVYPCFTVYVCTVGLTNRFSSNTSNRSRCCWGWT